jgi:hypothetical protein
MAFRKNAFAHEMRMLAGRPQRLSKDFFVLLCDVCISFQALMPPSRNLTGYRRVCKASATDWLTDPPFTQ